MFQGTVPKPIVVKIFEEIKENKNIKEIYVACSGNYTTERALFSLGLPIHSNDVSLYSTMLGDHFARQDRQITLSAIGKEKFPTLSDYLNTPIDKAATALCLSNILQILFPRNRFEERHLAAYLNKWDDHHKKTKDALQEKEFKLTSYSAEDFTVFLDKLPEENIAVLMFPPTYKMGYERMFKNLDLLFDWQKPTYEIFDPSTVGNLFTRTKNNTVFLMTDTEIETGVEIARFVSQSRKTTRLYTNESKGDNQLTQDGLTIRDLKQKLFLTGQIAPTAKLTIAQMDVGEFNTLRTLYLNKAIQMKNPSLCYSAQIDGKIIGAFGISMPPSYMAENYFGISPYCYLMSDFPIVCEIQKLAKLVLIAAMSKESQLAMQTSFGMRIRNVMTTAFTEKDISMKYRGLLKKFGDLSDDKKSGINYVGRVGEWTLEDGLTLWREKHAKN
jgi:hypothetical protein